MRGRPDRYTDGSDPLSDPKKARRLISASRPGAVMLAVVVVVVGLVLALSQLVGDDAADQPPAQVAEESPGETAPSGSPEDEPAPAESPASDEPDAQSDAGVEEAETPPAEAVQTAVEFTEAWKLDAPQEERRKALEAVATRHLTEALLLVRSSDLSTGDIVGEPEPIAFSDVFAKLHVSLSTGEIIAVSVAQQAEGDWRAVDVQPVQEPGTDESRDQS